MKEIKVYCNLCKIEIKEAKDSSNLPNGFNLHTPTPNSKKFVNYSLRSSVSQASCVNNHVCYKCAASFFRYILIDAPDMKDRIIDQLKFTT